MRAASLQLLPAAAVCLAGTAAAAFHQAVPAYLSTASASAPAAANLPDISPHIKAYNLSVPVDHFHNESKYAPHSHDTFPLRYWLDTTRYRPGGPVILLHSGEFDSTGRLAYLDHGIVKILAEALGGVGVVLEHRYYGTSWPVPDASAANMRFLTTDQALADTAFFARHASFPGLEHLNLTAGEAAPWIIYGGSYAGGLAALARKLYPDVFWGAISSSGVTAAVERFWQYHEAFRNFAPAGCSDAQQALTDIMDRILFGEDRAEAEALKRMFHLDGLRDDEFGSVVSGALGGLQATNWATEDDEDALAFYCAAITSTARLFASTAHLEDKARHFARLGGRSGRDLERRTAQMLNWAGYVRNMNKKAKRSGCKGQSNAECYSNRHVPDDTTVTNDMSRPWLWQTCTEWGYFQNGEHVPSDRLPLLSRAVTVEYSTVNCRRFFNITTPPDVDAINRHGGFGISYPRLAVIDGMQDPWRAATPHADGQPGRASTTERPFLTIDWGVHHWDEFGAREGATEGGLLPPRQVAENHRRQVEFVTAWLAEWKKTRKGEAEEGFGEL
ncbi:Peptidase S28 [Cordyceps fumosorosea ARSEF 2679]|uniref:Peptidase S28 n=1 Tax=Cordyceps fumosorosea (strain ARSEF 2679) TaxID=1081104 RepID=A0A168B5D6_CORFA|nr:Peptidase S28 [Cordyceps fumosorosea ARSEF 2679]OAA69641.1 Peptidase S28 [Cordyceps fumosorosea ARSEF 2679]